MRLITIAIANINPTVGAVRSNADRVLEVARQTAAEGVTLTCFPEQVIGGYPPEDLIQWHTFVAGQRTALERVARETVELSTVFVVGLTVPIGGQLFNSAAVMHRGTVLAFVPKEKLPTYSVFYESRTFSRGGPGLLLDAGGVPLGDRIFEFDFGRLAVEVCEDAWSPDGPMRRRCYSGAEVVVNISASPYRIGIAETRREMLATRSSDSQTVLVYANAVGAQDGLVFDGGGYVFQNGRPLLDVPRFREGFTTCVLDLDRTERMRREHTTWRRDCEAFQRTGAIVPSIRSEHPTPPQAARPYPVPEDGGFFLPSDRKPDRSPREEMLDELFEALALGVRDYYVKTRAFRGIGVALSGGRDSMLTLLVAWRALELLPTRAAHDALHAFYMPSRFSRAETKDAATTMCRELDLPLVTVFIDDAVAREIEATSTMLGGAELDAMTLQNIQVRIRAERMWNWSNGSGGLFLQTGDMSEKAVGYTTVGGDLEGALSVIANIPKTMVMALLDRLHARFGFQGIALVRRMGPSPELAADQEAEAELMPFPVLDACLSLYAGDKLSPGEVAIALQAAFPTYAPKQLERWAYTFAARFAKAVFKWVQAPVALHVGSLDLERERALQLPVVESGEWREASQRSGRRSSKRSTRRYGS